MSKQKLLDSWLSSTKIQKLQKPLTEANTSSLAPSTQKKSSLLCQICNTGGSLFSCINCHKDFHLSCINLQPLDLPLSQWPCSDCMSEYSTTYQKELEDLIKNQRVTKSRQAKKKLKSEIQNYFDPKIAKFQKKFPNLVKKGEILYPIDDSLLWTQPILHQVSILNFPMVHFPSIPEGIFPDLIAICDFSHKFRSFLRTPTMNCQQLYDSLIIGENSLMKTLVIKLLKPFTMCVIKSEGFRKDSALNFFIYKTKKMLSMNCLMDFYYLSILAQLFKLDIWQEFIEDYCKSFNFILKNFNFYKFYDFEPAAKVRVLDLLVELLLETRDINEECVQRHESQLLLKKELSEYIAQSRNNDSDELAEKIENIEKNLALVSVRTNKLGLDRNFNEYYYFAWDNLLYINFHGFSQDKPRWGVYKHRAEIENFVKCLSCKGAKESELIENLEDLLEKNVFFNENIEEISGNCEENVENYMGNAENYKENNENYENDARNYGKGNKGLCDDEMLYGVYDLQNLKDWLCRLYEFIKENLNLAPYERFKEKVNDADIQQISDIISRFHQIFPAKAWKKQLENLWEGSEYNTIWEKAVQSCSKPWELMGCLHFLENQIKNHCQKSQKEENKYESIRKEYRTERMKRLRKFQKDSI